MGDLTFRRAVRADVPAVVRLLADDHLGATRERATDPLPDAYWRAFDAVDADPRQLQSVGVDADGAVRACAQLTFIPGLSLVGGERLLIEAVRVDAALRGQGQGRRLFEWAIDQARARGCRLVQLTTNASRGDAHRFYESLGFEPSHVGMKLWLAPPES